MVFRQRTLPDNWVVQLGVQVSYQLLGLITRLMTRLDKELGAGIRYRCHPLLKLAWRVYMSILMGGDMYGGDMQVRHQLIWLQEWRQVSGFV